MIFFIPEVIKYNISLINKFFIVKDNFNYLYLNNLLYLLNTYFINDNYKNNLNILFINILNIKLISKTIKKGRIQTYQVLLLVGNKKNWIALGKGKHIKLFQAIENARFNSWNNQYFFNTLQSKYNKNINIKLYNLYNFKYKYKHINNILDIFNLNKFLIINKYKQLTYNNFNKFFKTIIKNEKKKFNKKIM